jgi:hypothetical protein
MILKNAIKNTKKAFKNGFKRRKITQIKGKKRFEAQREGECKEKRFNLSNFIFLKQTCIAVNYLS